MGLSICDSLMETVFMKRWVPLDGLRLAGIGLHAGRKGVSGYYYHF